MDVPNASNALNSSKRNARATNSSSNANTNSASKMDKAKELTKGVMEFIKGKGAIIFLLIIVVLLFVLVILYIIFQVKNSKLEGKLLVSKPIKLDELNAPREVKAKDIPSLVVGLEYSYTFWIYLDNYSQSITEDRKVPIDKMIFYRGSPSDIKGANPIVFMDGLSNKLYIAIKTKESTLTDTADVMYNKNLAHIRLKNYFLNEDLKMYDQSDANRLSINRHLVLTIDYVPLQRWVNVTFIVDNKITTIFLDGEIYSVKSTEEFKAMREREIDPLSQEVREANVIVDKTEGTIFIGKNSVGGNVTPPAYFNKLQFYNYALSLTEVKKIYTNGPLATGISIFGNSSLMSGYGFRAPIYKIDDVE
jgi:hypothetical protein